MNNEKVIFISLILISVSSCKTNSQTKPYYAKDFPSGIELGEIKNLDWDKKYSSVIDSQQQNKE